MSGSSAPSGETKYNWNEDMAPRWNNLLNTGFWQAFQPDGQGGYSVRPRETYTGERYAPLSYDQTAAGANIRSLNDLSTGTIQAGNAARGEISKTLGGNYLGGPNSNPYAGLAPAGMNPYIGGNPNMTQNTQTDRNLFAGDNPYFRNTVQSGMEDITNAYQQGTAADTTRKFALAGTFGGKAHEDIIARNEAGLGRSLNQYADSMMNQQFNRSAGLEDSFLSRDIQNQQFNKGQNAGLYENYLNRGSQNFNQGLDRGMSGWEGERGRMMGAVGAGQNEQGMALQRAQAQLGVGEMFQGQDQKNRDFSYDQWTQAQNHPFTTMDWLSGLFGRAQGGMGANSSIYQNSGSSPYLGAGLALASMFGGK